MWIASVPLILAALWLDKPWLLNWCLDSIGSLLILGIVCSGLAYLMYATLIQRTGPVFTSISNFIVPLVGVILGVAVRDESFTTRGWLALAFIISSLVINEMKIFYKSKVVNAEEF